jgi:hypothetical protein
MLQHDAGSLCTLSSLRKLNFTNNRIIIRCRAILRNQRHPDRSNVLVEAGAASNSGRFRDDDYPVEFPTRFELMQRLDKLKPLVRVRLSVHYRVHSRQILCIGGSQIPLGWSFLSIAKVPMTWNNGDIWTCEVRTTLLHASLACS